MKVTEWLDAINANLDIKYYSNQDGRYCAKIEDGEIKDGPILCSAFSNGKSPSEAALKYIKCIEGKLLVINAGSKEYRREFRVPSGMEVNI